MRRKTNIKPILFVSHVHEDAVIAKAIKQWLDKKLAKSINVFVSSDKKDSMKGGTSWWDEIRNNLSKSQVLVALITRRSIDRSWIHFEVGGAYFQRINVLPIIIGISETEIKSPLSQITYYNFSNNEEFRTFCEQILREYELSTNLFDKDILKKIIVLDNNIQSDHFPIPKIKIEKSNKTEKNISIFTTKEENEFKYFEKIFSTDIIIEVSLTDDANFLISYILETLQYRIPLVALLVSLLRNLRNTNVITFGNNNLQHDSIIFSEIENRMQKHLEKKGYHIDNIKIKNFPFLELKSANLINIKDTYNHSFYFTNKMFRFYHWLSFKSKIKSELEFKLISTKLRNNETMSRKGVTKKKR